MDRISVVGSSGSGKTTAARRIAGLLDVPYLELDAVFHQADWVPLADDEFREAVEQFASGDQWVIDGNYTSHGISDIVWPRADTIVWLDVARAAVMAQVVGRSLRRAVTGEELWNGNTERLRNLLSWDPEKNIIRWAWTRFEPTRSKYEGYAAGAHWSHLSIRRVRGRRDLDRLFAEIEESGRH